MNIITDWLKKFVKSSNLFTRYSLLSIFRIINNNYRYSSCRILCRLNDWTGNAKRRNTKSQFIYISHLLRFSAMLFTIVIYFWLYKSKYFSSWFTQLVIRHSAFLVPVMCLSSGIRIVSYFNQHISARRSRGVNRMNQYSFIAVAALLVTCYRSI